MSTPRALRTPLHLNLLVTVFMAGWVLVAIFPLFWTAIMSFKLPLDALSSNPLTVILGPATLKAGQGISVLDMLVGVGFLVAIYLAPGRLGRRMAEVLTLGGAVALGWVLAALLYVVAAAIALGWLMPVAASGLGALVGGIPVLGALLPAV